MLIHGETNFVLVRTLYVLDCHRRRDIRPSRLYVSPRTRLGSIGVPRHALGARKYSVGRTRIRPFGVRAAYAAFLLRVLQTGFGLATVVNALEDASP